MKKKHIYFWGVMGFWFAVGLTGVIFGSTWIKVFAMIDMVILFIASLIAIAD